VITPDNPIVCYHCGAAITRPDDPHRPACPVPELIALAMAPDPPAEAPVLPTHCAWCGAFLMGGLTQHGPECWIPRIGEDLGEVERRAGKWLALAECHCRTCGHAASSHVAGYCFECGRARCWS
jgi:hypothetical protein